MAGDAGDNDTAYRKAAATRMSVRVSRLLGHSPSFLTFLCPHFE